MRLLITGGNGRLARAVMAALDGENTVRAIDTHFTEPLPAGVDAQTGDLRDSEFIAGAMAGVDTVLHLAAIAPASENEREALDIATRGTYVVATQALAAGITRFVHGSSLAIFDRCPAQWRITEAWRPRPTTAPEQLFPWLSELSAKESFRVAPVRFAVLRFGRLVDDTEIAGHPHDPRWVHIADAVHGVECALNLPLEGAHPKHAHWVFHITAAGKGAKIRAAEALHGPFHYKPQHDFGSLPALPIPHQMLPEEGTARKQTWQEILAPIPTPSRPIRNVVIFGAGGPVAVSASEEMKDSYTLRLTDLRSLADIAAEGKPQSEGAPLPVPLDAPHECRTVDVRDGEQVMAACEGMDAIINCTVLRPDPVEAFLVNTLGAYNIMRAAIAHRIRRVVQTGPAQNLLQDEDGYFRDYEVPGDVPSRPGHQLYFHTKYLGQEICRVYAENFGLEVPNLLYCQFLNPDVTQGVHYFGVSWQDSARALRRAVEVPSLPLPYEVFNITADIPHGRFSNHRAKEALGWIPRDNVEHLWSDGHATS